MGPGESDAEELLEQAARGEAGARGRLLDRHRQRLCALVALRMDRRLAARVDPSDVVQESLAEAAQRLDDYLAARPMPFYPWLRKLTLEQLITLRRRHIQSQRRSVRREARPACPLPDESLHELAERLVSRGSSPSARLRRADERERVRLLLARLPEADRELLALRHLEHLSNREMAAVLGVSEAAVKVRHVRALARLRELLGPFAEEDGP
jgi:RNA polymerase sigma-70 factor (ECF subfamily)